MGYLGASPMGRGCDTATGSDHSDLRNLHHIDLLAFRAGSIRIVIVALLRRIEAHLEEIVRILRTPEDFSSEDAQLKAMTERENQSGKQVAEAIAELPPQPTEGKT